MHWRKKQLSLNHVNTWDFSTLHTSLIIRPEGAKIIGSNEPSSFSIKNSLQKIMKLLFKLGVCKASMKSRKVPSIHMI